MKTPVIAAVNGFALGGGLELAMAAHIRIFSENARLVYETSLSVILATAVQRLAQIAGKGRAMEMILSAEMINASKALDYGITNNVVPLKVNCFSKKMAQKIIKNSPMAVATAIQCINANYANGVDGMAYEINAFGNCFGTEDFHEGTRTFLKKKAGF